MNFDSGRILQHLVQNQCKRTFVLNLTLQASFVGWQSHYGLQMRWMCLNAAFYHRNPCFFTGIYPWRHITAELKQRYITLTLNPHPPPPQPNFGQLRHFGQQEKFGQSQFFMLVHRMTLLSFQLFSKNLGNLQEFFGQMVYRPPWQKIARTSMLIKINNIKSLDGVAITHPGRWSRFTYCLRCCCCCCCYFLRFAFWLQIFEY